MHLRVSRPIRIDAPAAAKRPTGAPAAAASTLATAISTGGTAGLAAPRTALVVSGVTLTEIDGTVIDKGDDPVAGLRIPIGAPGTTRASAALALAHLLAEGSAFDATLQLDDGEPLVRTKETHEPGGEQRTMHLTAQSSPQPSFT